MIVFIRSLGKVRLKTDNNIEELFQKTFKIVIDKVELI